MSLFGRRQPAYEPPPPPYNSIDAMNHVSDPLSHVVRSYSHGEWGRLRMMLGAYRGDDGYMKLTMTHPESNFLTLGPPRSAKTTGVQANQVLTHVGPRIVMSAKTDLAHLTAVGCSRMGPVWHFDATGLDPIPGLIPARWSMLAECTAWARTQRMGGALTGSSGDPHQQHKFWADQAGDYIACALYAAHLGGRDMDFVRRVGLGVPSACDELEAILAGDPRGEEALELWEATTGTHAEGLSSIRMSARAALRIFGRPEVRAQSENPNFDLRSFIRGEPDAMNFSFVETDEGPRQLAANGITARDGWPRTGQYPTLFITASSSDAEDAQTIYRAFMRLLWRECQELHREDKARGYRGRRPTLLIVDELGNLAPDPTYPAMVSQSADQGLLISSSLQDLSQAERHFGHEAKGFLSVHREVVVFPGIANVETLQAISTLIGMRWETRKTEGDNLTFGSNTSTGVNSSKNDHRVPILEPAQIRNGKPGDPKAALYIPLTEWAWVWPAPVWAAAPWPRALIASLALQSNKVMVDPEGQEWPVAAMPVPELDRVDHDGVPWLVKTQPDGDRLLDAYLTVKAIYARGGVA